jgi:HK97 gp10 family phage protein
MIDITCKIEGLDELKVTLDKAAKQAVKNYIRRAAKAAADIWVKAIVEKAPRDTGFLAEHIVVMTKYLEADTKLELHVGPEKAAFYALFLEFGTEFQAAQPFMRPAFEEHKDEVLAAFAEAMNVELKELEVKA